MIKHTPGKEHALDEFLSQITMGKPLEGVADEFPNVHLFSIEGVADWYDELLLFLENGTFVKG